jgi:hypothetical protein
MDFDNRYDSRALDRQVQGWLPMHTDDRARYRHVLRSVEALSSTATRA